MENPVRGMISEEIIEKWIPVIEGKGEWEVVKDLAPKVKSNQYGIMAQLLENTAQMINEVTTSSDIAGYNKILIPMVRRVAPALIANDIIGVQPMTGPTGLIFMLKAYYANTSDNPVKATNSVILTLADASAFNVGDSIASAGGGVGTVRYKEGNNILVQVTSGTFVAGEGVQKADSYNSSNANDTTIAAVYENEAVVNMIFTNYVGDYTTAQAEALSTDMREIGFDIVSKSVEAVSQKLKAKWTLEVEDDLKALHNLDAEMILTNIASEEIVNELNRKIINLVDTYATQGGVLTWDYSQADGRWEIEKYQNLLAFISRVRKQIARSTKRGQANWMIVSPDVASALEATGKLNATNADPYLNTFLGTINGMKVFVDLFAPENYILLGYKGAEEIDAGLFYAPYIPLKIEKGFGEETGQPRLFFRSRYGLTDNVAGGKNYFRKILVTNLPFSS